jgi:hypothetical protein
VGTLQHHAICPLAGRERACHDHGQASAAPASRLAPATAEVIVEIEHAFAAADDDRATGTKLGELAQDFPPPRRRQVARPIVVIELSRNRNAGSAGCSAC